jgi:polysaccharide biosynthesis transport protein
MPGSNPLVPVDRAYLQSSAPIGSDRQVRLPVTSERALNPTRLIQQTLAQWWFVSLVVALMLTTAAVAVVLQSFRPKYRAAVLIQIQEQAPFVVGPTGPSSSLYVPTQIEILRSRIVLEPVIERLAEENLAELQDPPDPLHSLGSRIRVSAVGTSELYEVSCDAYSAENAARLANSIVDSYFQYRSQTENERAHRVIELLQAESARRTQNLTSLRDRFRELGGRLAETGVVATATSSGSAQNPMPSTLQDRIVLAEVERQVLEAKIRSWDESAPSRPLVTEAAVAAAIAADPRVTKATATLQSLYETLQRVAVTSAGGKQSDAYRRTQDDIRRYEQTMAELRESLRPEVVERLTAAAESERQAERREMVTSLESYRLMEETLRDRYREQLAARSEATSASLDLEIVRSELEQEENVQQMLTERAAALRTELGAPQQVTLLKHALTPDRPISPLPWKRLAAAICLSFGAPFALALVWEGLVRRVRNRGQLEEGLELPVVGEVAKLPDRRYRQAIYMTDTSNELYTEGIDRLGASVLLACRTERTPVLAVTSAVSGEGKTRTSVQLAISLGGQLQQPVLLIDTDLRRPDVHRLLDIDMQPGLRDVLDGKCSIDQAIKRRTHHLHVLTAGACTRHPRELLGDQRFPALLSHLREKYRMIVVDTPPLLAASETLFVAGAADRVIICARRNFSREPYILKAYDDLLATGIAPLGVVLSGISRKQYTNSYGNYGYSMYSRTK